MPFSVAGLHRGCHLLRRAAQYRTGDFVRMRNSDSFFDRSDTLRLLFLFPRFYNTGMFFIFRVITESNQEDVSRIPLYPGGVILFFDLLNGALRRSIPPPVPDNSFPAGADRQHRQILFRRAVPELGLDNLFSHCSMPSGWYR